jgi:hypothetical protein
MSTKKGIANLKKMKLNELQAKYADVIGKKTRSTNRTALVHKIAESLQAPGSGDAGETTASPSASTVTEPSVVAAESSTNPGTATASESAVTADTETTAAPVAERLTKLTVPELQARYLEVVGRSTGSLPWCMALRAAHPGRVCECRVLEHASTHAAVASANRAAASSAPSSLR